MIKSVNFQKVTTISLIAISMQTLGISNVSANDTATPTPTGSLTPDTFTSTTIVGQTVSIDRTVTIDSIPDVVTTETITENRKLDVLFLADNTSSMGEAINNIKTNANSLLTNLSDNYGDVQFGVARYYGDPQESTECVGNWSYSGDLLVCDSHSSAKFGATGAYNLQKAINEGTKDQAITELNQWQPSAANADWAEGNFFALHQAATNGATVNGYGTGTEGNTNWRTNAEKVIVWFGDAYSNTGTINQEDTIAVLKAQGIKVVAIHVDSPTYANENGQRLSLVAGLNYNSQASTIATQTGGAYASADPAQLSETILRLVGDAVIQTTRETTTAGTVDLTFRAQSDSDLSGLNITYTCTDTLGCNDVESGQSRTFRMDVEGVAAGVYNFETQVVGVSNAVGIDRVTVVYFAD